MVESNNIIRDHKDLPTLEKDSLYVNRKKEIKIWEALTSILNEKHGLAIFVTLAGEAKEPKFEYENREINCQK